mgnify:FL=1|jgi:hypothetical protein
MIFTLLGGLLGIFIINTMFFAVPYLMPRINMMEVLSYQVFGNIMFFLFMVLPRNTGIFNFDDVDTKKLKK